MGSATNKEDDDKSGAGAELYCNEWGTSPVSEVTSLFSKVKGLKLPHL